jgi:hypothetical protein
MASYSSEYTLRMPDGSKVDSGFKDAIAIDWEPSYIRIHFSDGFLIIPIENIVGDLYIDLVK